MSRTHLSLALTASLALAASALGCSAERTGPPAEVVAEPGSAKPTNEKPATPVEKAELKEKKFGKPVSPGGATSLASIVKDPAKFSGQSVKTEGVVKSVCKAAGCWMEIEDESGRAHVKMAGHAFYVPKNCDGHRAVVEGTVKAGEPTNDCGAKDSCGGEEHGALAKLEIEATGVEFVD